eukprot:8881103-Lingulodinium_polyedra.AAC.1
MGVVQQRRDDHGLVQPEGGRPFGVRLVGGGAKVADRHHGLLASVSKRRPGSGVGVDAGPEVGVAGNHGDHELVSGAHDRSWL